MFQSLFTFIRNGVCSAILGGVQDAQEKLTEHAQTDEPLTIEADITEPIPKTNGRKRVKSR